MSKFIVGDSIVAYTNILVALDISDEAGEVLDSARRLMSDEGAQLSIVNVIKPITGFYVDIFSVLADQGGIESQAIEYASQWLKELAQNQGVEPKSIDILLGTPAVEIRRKAEEINAEIIVLGTHGRYGLGRLLGSTANGVLHGAPCDVLAVKVRTETK
ncbi:universal stress protein [Pseudohalioglobus lutimaris]|uniref:universal stress protein n=1 Tax=Pseudohalioglobus lutimaris TaxID=1737061 RepID=UPI0013FDEEA7|nr:universal stress protein [Pseudohalioglobus lutimaris]